MAAILILLTAWVRYASAEDAGTPATHVSSAEQLLLDSGAEVEFVRTEGVFVAREVRWWWNPPRPEEAIAQLQNLPRLERVHFLCDLSADALLHMGRLPSLKAVYVNARGMPPSGLEGLRESENLLGVNLHWNIVTGLDFIRPMQALRVLSIANGRLNDDDIAHVAASDRLRSLDLSNRFELSPEAVGTIARLPELRHLGLGFGGMSDAHVAPIAEAARLKSLRLGANLTGGSLRRLEGLAELESLTLRNCRLTPSAMRAIGRFPALQRLEMIHCEMVPGPEAPYPGFERLDCLSLTFNESFAQSVPNLAQWSGAKNLRSLTLCSEPCRLAPSDVLAGLDRLSTLESVTIQSVRIDRAGAERIGALKDLKVLRLLGWELPADLDLTALPPLPSLRTIEIYRETTPQELLHLLSHARNLQEIDIHHARLTPAVAAKFSQLGSLCILRLSDPSIECEETIGAILRIASLEELSIWGADSPLTRFPLDGVPRLKRLEVTRNPSMDDDVLNTLGHAPSLESLILFRTGVTRSGIRSLIPLSGLRYLDLEGNDLTDDVAAELLCLPNLTRVDLKNTAVTHAILEELTVHPTLSRIQLEKTRARLATHPADRQP